jgi:hypothetical protein
LPRSYHEWFVDLNSDSIKVILVVRPAAESAGCSWAQLHHWKVSTYVARLMWLMCDWQWNRMFAGRLLLPIGNCTGPESQFRMLKRLNDVAVLLIYRPSSWFASAASCCSSCNDYASELRIIGELGPRCPCMHINSRSRRGATSVDSTHIRLRFPPTQRRVEAAGRRLRVGSGG